MSLNHKTGLMAMLRMRKISQAQEDHTFQLGVGCYFIHKYAHSMLFTCLIFHSNCFSIFKISYLQKEKEVMKSSF